MPCQTDNYCYPFWKKLLLHMYLPHFSSITGHIQIAQVPGRHEPDENGELNFPFLFKLLGLQNYKGWIGCEYQPRGWYRAVRHGDKRSCMRPSLSVYEEPSLFVEFSQVDSKSSVTIHTLHSCSRDKPLCMVASL